MCCGGVQLIPNASTRSVRPAERITSPIGVPSLRCSPSRQQKETHASTSGISARSSAAIPASRPFGIVSIAITSLPAATSCSMRARWVVAICSSVARA